MTTETIQRIEELGKHLIEVSKKVGISKAETPQSKDLQNLSEQEIVSEINIYIGNLNNAIARKKEELISIEKDLAVKESQLDTYLETTKNLFDLPMKEPLQELSDLISHKTKEQERLIASYQSLLTNLQKIED